MSSLFTSAIASAYPTPGPRDVMSRAKWIGLGVAALTVVIAGTILVVLWPRDEVAPDSQFVRRDGSQLVLDGRPFTAAGSNNYRPAFIEPALVDQIMHTAALPARPRDGRPQPCRRRRPERGDRAGWHHAGDGGVLSFEPAPGYTGRLDFTYTVSDVDGRSSEATTGVIRVD